MLPSAAPVPLSLLPSRLSESAPPFRGPWEGYTSLSFLCCPLLPFFHFKTSHPDCIKDERVCRVLGFRDSRPRKDSGLPQAAQQGQSHLFSLLPPCFLAPLLLPPPASASSSPLPSTCKTSKPIKGAGKIMNKPGKHEINIRRKNTTAIK